MFLLQIMWRQKDGTHVTNEGTVNDDPTQHDFIIDNAFPRLEAVVVYKHMSRKLYAQGHPRYDPVINKTMICWQ
jgi:hypothetical protein